MEVTADEIAYINYQMYKNGQSDEWSTIKDSPGIVHLNGQEALWYARNRGLTKGEDDNEIGRGMKRIGWFFILGAVVLSLVIGVFAFRR